MKVYVLTGFKKEDFPTQYKLIDVFESEKDAEAFCVEQNDYGWQYQIHAKEIIRNSAGYQHPTVLSEPFHVNECDIETLHIMYKAVKIDFHEELGENK